MSYGVASVSKIDKTTGFFCYGALEKRRYPAKETDNFVDPPDRSHPMRHTMSELCDWCMICHII